jgi:hypothetical protein
VPFLSLISSLNRFLLPPSYALSFQFKSHRRFQCNFIPILFHFDAAISFHAMQLVQLISKQPWLFSSDLDGWRASKRSTADKVRWEKENEPPIFWSFEGDAAADVDVSLIQSAPRRTGVVDYAALVARVCVLVFFSKLFACAPPARVLCFILTKL